MHLLDFALPTPEENLACDEALLDESEEADGAETLRFWESPLPFVVLGYTDSVEQNVDTAACRRLNIPILRRCSGGGTVLQGPGCLSYCLILAIPDAGPLASISGTNQWIMERHARALETLLQQPVLSGGHSDLTLRNLKVSGNAQRRRRRRLMFHGTFLLQADLGLMQQVLRQPPRQPAYRHNRGHEEFLTNLHVTPATVQQALTTEWGAAEAGSVPLRRVEELVERRYGVVEWTGKFP